MSTDIEANKGVVVAFADAFAQGDWNRLGALLTEDFQWIWPVGGPLQSGQLRSQEIPETASTARPRSRSETIDIFDMTKRTSKDGRFDLKITNMVGEGDRVATEAESSAICKATSRVYSNKYHWMMQFRDGKICLFREYHDTLHAYDVWTAP